MRIDPNLEDISGADFTNYAAVGLILELAFTRRTRDYLSDLALIEMALQIAHIREVS